MLCIDFTKCIDALLTILEAIQVVFMDDEIVDIKAIIFIKIYFAVISTLVRINIITQ
jgi:hypothetical protein